MSMYNPEVVVPLPDDYIGAIEWLINEGILRKEMVCPKCNQKMELKETKKSFDPLYSQPIDEPESNKTCDPLSWQCLNLECSASKRPDEVWCRKGSYFENRPRVNLAKWINIVKGWCYEKSQDKVMLDVRLENETVPMVYGKCRELCKNVLLMGSIKLENDVILATVKNYLKTDEISGISNETHLLVMVDNTTTPVIGYMEILTPENRDVDSILSIIKSVIKLQPIVFIEECVDLSKAKSTHNFDLRKMSTGNSALKNYIKFHKKVIEKIQEPGLINPQDYLYESMWRERFRTRRCKTFINQLYQWCMYGN